MTDARDDVPERDAVIARVVDVVDPVDPAPGFWQEVEARLRDDGTTAPVHELARIAGGRRGPSQADRRRWLGLAGAAAALVAVAVLGALAFLGDDPERTETLPPTESSTTTSTTSAADAAAAAAEAQAKDAADGWMLAASRGDAETMWARMGAQSRGSWSGLPAFSEEVDQLGTAWAWRSGSPRPAMTAIEVGTGHDLYLVRVETTTVRPPDLVVRLSPAGNPGAHVEPFLPGPALGLLDLPTGAVQEGVVVPVAVDAEVASSLVLVDGTPVAEEALRRSRDGAVTGLRTDGLERGRHQVEVVVETAGGTLLQAVADLEISGRSAT